VQPSVLKNERNLSIICETLTLRFGSIAKLAHLLRKPKRVTSERLVTTSVPVTVAEQSNTRIVFARSNTGIVGSSVTRGMDVCVRVYVHLFRVSFAIIPRLKSTTDCV
jgi:hypothetical protein